MSAMHRVVTVGLMACALAIEPAGIALAAGDETRPQDASSVEARVDPSLLSGGSWRAMSSNVAIRIEGRGDAETTREALVADGLVGRSAKAIAGTSIVTARVPRGLVRTLAKSRDVASLTPDVTVSVVPIETEASLDSAGVGPEMTSPAPNGAPSPRALAHTSPPPTGEGTPQADPHGSLYAVTELSEFDPDLTRLRRDWGLSGDGDGSPYTYSTGDQVIAIVDTGIDETHALLDDGKVLLHKDFSERTSACPVGPEVTGKWDERGHGTAVASVAAGRDGERLGIAPGAALIDLKVFSCAEGADVSRVDAALGWVLDNRDRYGIDIVNLSLGTKLVNDGTDPTSRLVNRLVAHGVSVAIAAGNGGVDPLGLSTPATAQHALTVGAQGARAVGEYLAPFSSWGPTADGRDGVDLLAPGVNVPVAGDMRFLNDMHSLSGTSFSSPYVAGILALLRAASPDVRPTGDVCAPQDMSPDCWDGVRDVTDPLAKALTGTAADLFESGSDPVSGFGLVRPTRALAKLTGRRFDDGYPATSSIPPTEVPFGGALALLVDSRDGYVGITVRTDPMFEPIQDEHVFQLLTDFSAIHLDGSAAELHWPMMAGSPLVPVRTPIVYVPQSPDPTWVLVEGPPNDGRSSTIAAAVSGRLVSHTVLEGFPEVLGEVEEGAGQGTIDVRMRGVAPGRYGVAGDGQVRGFADVVVGAESGEQVQSLQVAARDDRASEGRHTGQLTLLPKQAALTPPINLSIPIEDDETGPVEVRRVLLNGRELPRRTRETGEHSYVGNDGTVATSLLIGNAQGAPRSQIFVSRRGGDFAAVTMSERGKSLEECWHAPAGLEASGRYMIAVVAPDCAVDASAAAARDRPAVMWTDLDTGEVRYVGPSAEYLAKTPPLELLDLVLHSAISTDGMSVAYLAPGPGGYGLYWRNVRDDSPILLMSTKSANAMADQWSRFSRILAVTEEFVTLEYAQGMQVQHIRVSIDAPHTVEVLPLRVPGIDSTPTDFEVLASSSRGSAFVFRRLDQNGKFVYDTESDTVTPLKPAVGPIMSPRWISDDGREVGSDQSYGYGSATRAYLPAAFDVGTGRATGYASPATSDQQTVLSADGTRALSVFHSYFGHLAGTSPIPMAPGDTNAGPDFVVGRRLGPVALPATPQVRTTRTSDGVTVDWDPVPGAVRYVVTTAWPTGPGVEFDIGASTSWTYPASQVRNATTVQVRAVGVQPSGPALVRISKRRIFGTITKAESSGGQIRASWTASSGGELGRRQQSELQWQVSVDGSGWRNATHRQPADQSAPSTVVLSDLPIGSVVRLRVAVFDRDDQHPWSPPSDPVIVGSAGTRFAPPDQTELPDLVHVSPSEVDAQSAEAIDPLVANKKLAKAPTMEVARKRAFALRTRGLEKDQRVTLSLGRDQGEWITIGEGTTTGAGEILSRWVVVDREMELVVRVRAKGAANRYLRVRVIP